MVAAHILQWASTRKSWKCLFVVNRDVLVDQTYRSLERLGLAEKVGFLRGGCSSFEESKSIHIASIQYLRQRGAVLPAARLVVIDEAHCMLAKSYTELVGSYAGSIFLGMTATPFRTKAEEKLGLIFNQFICGPSVNELVHRGILVKPIMYIDPLPKTDTEEGMAKTVAAFSKYCQAAAGRQRRRTICFCKTVLHAHALSAKFNAAGIAAASVDGHTKADEREAIFEKFAQGVCQVLTSVDVLSEGFDEPRVSAVMLLRATDSKGLYIQQVGRGLRSCSYSCALDGKKKEDCLVIDMAGNIQKHGAVTGPRQYSLEGAHSAQLVFSTAQQKKNKKKFEPVRRCSNPSCGTWMHYQVEDCQLTLTLNPIP